jgi:hypothetical protein
MNQRVVIETEHKPTGHLFPALPFLYVQKKFLLLSLINLRKNILYTYSLTSPYKQNKPPMVGERVKVTPRSATADKIDCKTI